jgi:hypothetical protein
MLFDPVLERCAIELKEIETTMRGLAFSRLADTTAWVHACWSLAQAQGALRRAEHAPQAGIRELEAAAHATRSALAALRELERLCGEAATASGRAALSYGTRTRPTPGPASEWPPSE